LSSLVRIATNLKEKKHEVSKLRRKSERELKNVRSLSRRSTSGLATVERKIESSRVQLSDVSDVLNQKIAQQESLQRLIIAAQERLKRENEVKEQTEREIEFAETEEEKKNAQSRLGSISGKINEITFEIKQRAKTAQKIVKAIEEYKKSKSKISHKIQKQTKQKPQLIQLIKTSKKATERITKQVASKTRKEQSAKAGLVKITAKLIEIQNKRRRLAAKSI